MTKKIHESPDPIYASDKNFRIYPLNAGKQFLRGTKWEKISFDVWYKDFLGWLDVLIKENGDCVWHYFERDPNDPDKGVLLYHAPLRVDVTNRRGIFETICEKALHCHNFTLEHDDSELDWKQSSIKISQRVEEVE